MRLLFEVDYWLVRTQDGEFLLNNREVESLATCELLRLATIFADPLICMQWTARATRSETCLHSPPHDKQVPSVLVHVLSVPTKVALHELDAAD